MKKGSKKCDSCGDVITPSQMENGDFVTDVNGKICCNGCLEHAGEYATTLELIVAGDSDVCRLSERFGNLTDGENSFPAPIKSLQWKNSGGYRGYTDWELCEGYKELTGGWITGYPDSTTQRKVELSDIYESLKSDKPFDKPIWWIFAPTSNIFSMSSGIVIKEEDEQAFLDYLQNQQGLSLSDIEYMFS